jgi:hypothetical protein
LNDFQLLGAGGQAMKRWRRLVSRVHGVQASRGGSHTRQAAAVTITEEITKHPPLRACVPRTRGLAAGIERRGLIKKTVTSAGRRASMCKTSSPSPKSLDPDLAARSEFL